MQLVREPQKFGAVRVQLGVSALPWRRKEEEKRGRGKGFKLEIFPRDVRESESERDYNTHCNTHCNARTTTHTTTHTALSLHATPAALFSFYPLLPRQMGIGERLCDLLLARDPVL